MLHITPTNTTCNTKKKFCKTPPGFEPRTAPLNHVAYAGLGGCGGGDIFYTILVLKRVGSDTIEWGERSEPKGSDVNTFLMTKNDQQTRNDSMFNERRKTVRAATAADVCSGS